jgi:hypothetical protein
MNKLTIFFIIATVLIVSVTGTILGFKYFSGGEEEAVKPLYVTETVVETPDTIKEPDVAEQPEVVEQPEEETGPVEAPPGVVDPFAMFEPPAEEVVKEKTPIIAGIDEAKINNAGFKDNTLDVLNFDGIVFNDFNMAEYNDDDHILYILLSGEEESAKITELFFPSLEISDEVYASLKAKMTDSGYFEINETDQYGDHSYFANHATEQNSVFLVVKIRERLYTLHYPAKNHNKIKNLINLL